MDPTPLEPPTDLVDIVCPRCGDPACERLYGPCGACRDVLRSTLGGDKRDIATEEYIPKMNVTPNAVASKD
jgi:cytidine deaminase